MESSVVMAAAGTVTGFLWTALFIKGTGKYEKIASSKAVQELKFSGLFPAGFGIMNMLGINVRSAGFTEKRKAAAEIYGEKYAEFYTYLFTAAQISYGAALIPASLLAGAVTGSTALAVTGLAAAVLMLFILDGELRKKVEEKHESVMCELPDIILRLTLLISAGMVLRDAWNTVADSTDTELGREMRQTGSDIRNGMPEQDAFDAFARRCRTKEIRKFSAALVQNMKKGSAGLSECLQLLASEQWDEKKNYVRKKAASSEQKLLLPMIMIFAAVIMMIVVPVFTNIM